MERILNFIAHLFISITNAENDCHQLVQRIKMIQIRARDYQNEIEIGRRVLCTPSQLLSLEAEWHKYGIGRAQVASRMIAETPSLDVRSTLVAHRSTSETNAAWNVSIFDCIEV